MDLPSINLASTVTILLENTCVRLSVHRDLTCLQSQLIAGCIQPGSEEDEQHIAASTLGQCIVHEIACRLRGFVKDITGVRVH